MRNARHRPGPAHHNFFIASFKHADDIKWLVMAIMTSMQLEIFDLDSIRIESSDQLDRMDLAGRYSDLVISVQLKGGGKVAITFLIEHKSSPDQGLMLQLLAYMASIYSSGVEAVVPVVIYHGKSRWRIEKTFRAFAHAGLEPRFLERFGECLIDFKAVYVDLGEPQVRDRFAQLPADKSVALQALSQIWDADERTFAQWLAQLRGLHGNRLRETVVRMHTYFVKVFPSAKIDAVQRELKAIRPGDKAMQDVLSVWEGVLPNTHQETHDAAIEMGREEGIEMGREEGIEMGREEGIEMGREEGIEMGREEGSRNERIRLAKRLLTEPQMSDAKVARLTGMPLSEVQALKA